MFACFGLKSHKHKRLDRVAEAEYVLGNTMERGLSLDRAISHRTPLLERNGHIPEPRGTPLPIRGSFKRKKRKPSGYEQDAYPVKVSRPSIGVSNNNNHVPPHHAPNSNETLKKLEAQVSALTTEARSACEERDRAAKGLEALTVIIKYLTEEYDAFSTPSLKKEIQRLCGQLTEAKLTNDESLTSIIRLQDESVDQLKEHERNKQLLVDQHNKVLKEKEQLYKEDIEAASEKHQLELRNSEDKTELKIDSLKREHNHELQRLEEKWRVEVSKQLDAHLKEISQLNASHRTQLQECETRWKEQEKSLEEMAAKLQKEKESLVHKTKKLEETLLSDEDHRLQAAKRVCSSMQDEVNSLKTVVEMRTCEVRKLRDQLGDKERLTHELDRERERVRAFRAKTEDLLAQMDNKAKIERHLVADYRALSASLHRESATNKRLSLANEELSWRLRQRDAARDSSCPPQLMRQRDTLLGKDNSSSCSDLPKHTMLGKDIHTFTSGAPRRDAHAPSPGQSVQLPQQHSLSLDKERSQSERSYETDSDTFSPLPDYLNRYSHNYELSPPSSPRVKAVIEKSNSVSFILDLDDTFPEDPFLGLPSSPIFRNQRRTRMNKLEKSCSTSILGNANYKTRPDRFAVPFGSKNNKVKNIKKEIMSRHSNKNEEERGMRHKNGEDEIRNNFDNGHRNSAEDYDKNYHSYHGRAHSNSESSDGDMERVSPTGVAWTVPFHSNNRKLGSHPLDLKDHHFHKREVGRYSDYSHAPRLLKLPDEDEYGEHSENEFVEVLELNQDIFNQDLNATPLSSLFSETPTTSVSLSDCDLSRSESRVSSNESEEDESTENETLGALPPRNVVDLVHEGGEGMVSPDGFMLKENVSESSSEKNKCTISSDSNLNTPNGDDCLNISWSEADCDLTSSSDIQEV